MPCHRSHTYGSGVDDYMADLNDPDRYPTLEEVDCADKEQLARWWRFGPRPANNAQHVIQGRMIERFIDEMGGWTVELSKKVGWDKPGGAQ